METQLFLPDPAGTRCDAFHIEEGFVIFEVIAIQSTAPCPHCGQSSCRVHSRYTRILADLPWMGTPAQLRLLARRFFCDSLACPCATFAEPMPIVAPAHARRTCRLAQALCWIGLAVGGQAGSRLARHLNMPTSGDTLLRLVRRIPFVPVPTVNVLGVDDWAWHKGLSYGTILCDLEQHRPVDLLRERSADGLSTWLIAHPGVHVIARDRAGNYAQGAKAGAPQAIQVADRFHLLCNLREALKRTLDRHHQDLREAARTAAVSQSQPSQPVVEAAPVSAPPNSLPTRAQQAKEASRSRRLERYGQVLELRQQGMSMRQIGKQPGMHRGTVRRFLRAGQFPERAARRYISGADRFLEYLRQRWEQGCRNAAQLARELSQRGFVGSYSIVRRRVASWRQPGSAHTTGPKPTAKVPPPIQHPSANHVAWLLLKNPEDHLAEEQAFVEVLWDQCPTLKAETELAHEFVKMVHDRKVEMLEDWIARTHGPMVPPELRAFADGLRQDYKAVNAALSLEWSSGQVEGQINRLKMIKRQMYGRAGFDLLRQRVLYAE